MQEQRFPWQDESDPEKALEKIFEVIADEWIIYEDANINGLQPKRKIEFTLSPGFNSLHVYPSLIQIKEAKVI